MGYGITEKRGPAIHYGVSDRVITREEVVNYPFKSCSENSAGGDPVKKDVIFLH
jgi:hypothetical protein